MPQDGNGDYPQDYTSGNIPTDDFLFMDPRKKDYPRVSVSPGEEPIDALKPGSEAHDRVLAYLLRRIEDSEEAMTDFYDRWEVAERKVQAWINLPNWEQTLKDANKNGKPPQVVDVVIPFSYAIVQTIVTYLLHAFAGRKPIFQVNTYKPEDVLAAEAMEKVMQYNADHTRYVRALSNMIQDSQIYGVGITRSMWKTETAWRTNRVQTPQFSIFGREIGSTTEAEREQRTVYEGNMAYSQDPFMFFPDPRVPMTEVNRRGEYVFWRNFQGCHALLKEESEGTLKWVKQTPRGLPASGKYSSVRNLMSGGSSQPGMNEGRRFMGSGDYYQVDQGTVEIIPRQLGLGESMVPEKWLFTILNKKQIVQAEPFNADHDMHPVQVTEPYSLGYGFGNLGIVDYINPIQDLISWLFNSHLDNVRRVINDSMIVDPLAVEMQDLRQSGPGRIIRMKRSAANRDVRSAISQLQVSDVTGGHIADAQALLRIGQMLSAVTDNIMGMQDEGGRKTATEVRQSGQAAASRLANLAKVISSQSMVDTAEVWSLNIQQNISEEFAIQVLGKDGAELKITPDQLNGDFNFPIHDGTLPLDKVALMDVWKEVFAITLQDQQLRQTMDIPKMFEYIAELGGAQNIQSFKANVVPDEQVAQMAQDGNIVPLGAPRLGDITQNTMNESPADRIREG